MAGIAFDGDDSSRFLCDESKDSCFDDPDQTPHPESDPSMAPAPLMSDETFYSMLERQNQYFPNEDYLLRLRSGELNLNFRKDAFDWIWKAHAHYCFRPLSFCLSINYMDRFLSLHDLPKDKAWAVQLLAVACLSIAVKMEETDFPNPIELQVADPEFVFESKTIQRMELLVLTTLKWQMSAITPCSFVDYFLAKITDGNPLPTNLINKSLQLILCTIRGLDFLEFKPSEVAAAVAISVAARETQTVNIDRVISVQPSSSSSSIHVQKDRVVQCIELIKDFSLMSGSGDVSSLLPESPVGVLEARCFSNRSYETTVGSCTNSPDIKRKRLDNTISRGHSSKS